MTTTDPAVALLAEALTAFAVAPPADDFLVVTWNDGGGFAKELLDASPTLARRLALGTALDAAGTIDVGAALAAKLGSGK